MTDAKAPPPELVQWAHRQIALQLLAIDGSDAATALASAVQAKLDEQDSNAYARGGRDESERAAKAMAAALETQAAALRAKVAPLVEAARSVVGSERVDESVGPTDCAEVDGDALDALRAKDGIQRMWDPPEPEDPDDPDDLSPKGGRFARSKPICEK